MISACVGSVPAATIAPPSAVSPASATVRAAASPTDAATTMTPQSVATLAPATSTAPPTVLPATPTEPLLSHTIAPGETLYSIATRYGITVDALRAANGLSGDLIYAGQVLVIPAGATSPATSTPTVSVGGQPLPMGGPRRISLVQSAGATLAGSRWLLAGLAGGYIVRDSGLTLAFTPEAFSGTSACAHFSATYRVITAGVLEVGPAAITEQACSESQRLDSIGFFDALAGATTWVQDASHLYLSDGYGTPLATLARPDAALPVITALKVNASVPAVDSPLTIEWATANASSTKLQVIHGDDSVAQWSFALEQPASGQTVLTDIPAHNGGTTKVILEAYGPGGLYTVQTATVQLPCRHASPFSPTYPHGCPSGPATGIQLSEQRFEHGWMLWLSDPAWGVGGSVEILVLNDNGTLLHYLDTWRTGDPDPVDVAPPGLFVPKRGFGAVWATWNLRQSLGWAVEPERAVAGALIQRFGGYRQPMVHLRLSDGRVIYLSAESSGPQVWVFD